MEKSRVDVPVALNVFIRPNDLAKVFCNIKIAKPSILFLISDGPRQNTDDKKRIEKSREVVEDIDWDCKVYKIYSEINQGMYATYFNAQKEIFNIVDRCIFLEDDVLVSVSFFKFCEELLEKYKNDYRISYITGMNYLDIHEETPNDYFFAGEGSIWGYATWKRTYLQQNLKYTKNNYYLNCSIEAAKRIKKGYEKMLIGYRDDYNYSGHIPGPEFYKNMFRFVYNQLVIVPKYNMVSNIGVGDTSIHAANSLKKMPRTVQKLFFKKTFEYDQAIKHPEIVVCDYRYDKKVNKILAFNRPLITICRNISIVVRHIIVLDFSRLLKSFMKRFKKNYEK